MSEGSGSGFAAFGADQASKSETAEPTSPEEGSTVTKSLGICSRYVNATSYFSGDSSEASEPQPHPVCSGEEGESLMY